jgi:predicted glutamine amidotransferase
MCRLAGWFNPEFPEGTDRARLLRHLMRKSQAGGEASFGMAIVNNGKAKAVRHVGPASTWLEAHKKDIAECSKAQVIIGHTRQPTRGAVTKANCHPFTIGEWAAAHNGMISNSSSLMEASLYVPRGETDSEEALCYIISKDWEAEAINRVLGSYAFTGAKADGSEVVLVCDSGQNLHYVRFGNGLVWATSDVVLKSSLAAVGINATPVKMSKEIIRVPAWTTQPVDTTVTTYQGHGAYTHGSGYSSYGGRPSFPSVPADDENDANDLCMEKDCYHAFSIHRKDTGCHASMLDHTVCPCSKFVPSVIKNPGDCPKCPHSKVAHNSNVGCARGGCPCTEGKVSPSSRASQPTLPLSQGSENEAPTGSDTDKDAQVEAQVIAQIEEQLIAEASDQMVTEAELAQLKANGTGMIDID